MMEEEKTSYKAIAKLVDEWVPLHVGQTFDIDMICRDLQAVSRSARHAVTTKLFNDCKTGKCEKANRLYKYISFNKEYIPWYDFTEDDVIPFNWPKGRDGSKFPFDGHLKFRPTDLFVMAGVSNKGKSTIAKNILWENMDEWNGRITLFVNEYQPARFARNADMMCWNTPFNLDGKPKFELLRLEGDWQYAIEPDHLNIIDWIELADDFFRIGEILKAIQQKLRKGMAVVIIQKGEGRELGTGGQFGEHRASYYWAVDEGRFLFKKAKEYNDYNPNGKTYGFTTAEGCFMNNLRELKKCCQCAGTGERYSREAGGKISCLGCEGKGWL